MVIERAVVHVCIAVRTTEEVTTATFESSQTNPLLQVAHRLGPSFGFAAEASGATTSATTNWTEDGCKETATGSTDLVSASTSAVAAKVSFKMLLDEDVQPDTADANLAPCSC